jgi:hypothetical protein
VEPIHDRRFHQKGSVCHCRCARESTCGRRPPLCRSLLSSQPFRDASRLYVRNDQDLGDLEAMARVFQE